MTEANRSAQSPAVEMATLGALGSIGRGNPPETNIYITHEGSNLEHYRILMNFIGKGNNMEDSEVLESLLPLSAPGRIPELVDYGLKLCSANPEQLIVVVEAKLLCTIGDLCASRYTRLDRLELANIAIECYHRAISVAPHGTLDVARLADTDMGIACLSYATSLIPDGHMAKLDVLRDLALLDYGRFDCLKETADIDMTILYHIQAVSLVSDDDPDKPAHLGNLGNSYVRRFKHLREPLDLDTSIANHIQAESMTPDGHPHKAGMLNNPAGSYFWRFERLGNIEDLATTIELYAQAASLTPDEYLINREC
ncbi:hypothetical protein FRC06_001504 [Ceratobasidium sp. 370]|nr:hypothetical protein FRC06_001504 [Ceratobasidium sp. 370]